ncbi:hypothetical protein M440DRAFT_1471948 [Trichoderma longibrachiatum ATCC 18648]|uniref:Carbohydrate-binding module family 18 protein n=1 Tax=Trichoderma longibrachiatum ATCC 18648 TaxID=983965 RepID=A0A2T4BX98_TRILO|nr:hypothetical protein M440DRAFT_1471948 [Trichoderma longibrachiatum ATCC 18648]
MISNSATKFLLLLLLSPTPLAATTLIPHKPPARLLAQAPPTTPLQALSAIIIVAAQCRPGESTCNAGCMPPRSECCPDGLGYCKQGYACVVPCGEKLCMPEGAVCCSDGGYCHVGEECFQNGFKEYCQKVGDNGSTTTGPTRTGTVAESTTTARDQSTASSGALSSKTIADDSLASTTAETQTEAPTSASTSAQGISFESVSNIRSTPGVVSSPPFRPEESSSSSTTTTTASSTSSATGPSTATSTSDGHVVNQNVMLGAIMALAAVSIMTVL